MGKHIKATGFQDWDPMYYNNLLCIPVLIVFSVPFEDWRSANILGNFPVGNRSFLLLAIDFSGAVAISISYSTAWCVRIGGSTTYSMVCALNKYVATMRYLIPNYRLPPLASFFFGDSANLGNISAIGVGNVSGVVYPISKTNHSKADGEELATV
jgi:GDP-mannose transporter